MEFDVNMDTNLKAHLEKHKEYLTKKDKSYVTNNEWKSSNFYVLPKIDKSEIIIQEVKKSNSEYIMMVPPHDLNSIQTGLFENVSLISQHSVVSV